MTRPPAAVRYRAVAMELAACLDPHNVEMRILTDSGETVTIVCPRDSIFAIQRHIAQIVAACPEISSWRINAAAAAENSTDPRSSARCGELSFHHLSGDTHV